MEDTADFSIAVRPNDLDVVPGAVTGIVEKATLSHLVMRLPSMLSSFKQGPLPRPWKHLETL